MDGYITIGTQIDTKEFDSQIKHIENKMLDIEDKLKQADMGFEVGDTTKLEAEYERLGNQLIGLKQKQDKYNQSIEETSHKDLSGIRMQMSNIGNTLEGVIHKVVRWGLAVFGIRSAYRFVRMAVSELSQSNEQLGSDIEYIRYALASTLEPIITRLVQFVYKLLNAIGYVIKLFTGKNIFANANKGINKTSSGLKSATKEAKELRKQLAGFDEMNILQKDGSVSGAGGSGGGGGVSPSFDLSDLKEPDWSKIYTWTDKLKDIFNKAFFEIKQNIIGAMKDLGFSEAFINAFSIAFDGTVMMFNGFLDTVSGILEIIVGFATGDAMKIREGTRKLLEGLKGMIKGFFLFTIGMIKMQVQIIFDIVNLTYQKIKEKIHQWINGTKSLTQARKDLKKATDNLKSAENDYIDAIDRSEEAQKKLEEAQKRTGLSGEKLNKMVEQGTLDYRNMTPAQKEVYKAYIENNQAQKNLEITTKNYTKAQKEQIIASLEKQASLAKESKDYDKLKKSVIDAMNQGKISSQDAEKILKKSMKGMSDQSKQTFTKDLPDNVKKGLDTSKFQSTFNKFKNSWNNFWNSLKTKLTMNVDAKVSKKGGGGFRAKGGIFYPSKLPKLASGGIVSRPGPGVPYNGAIIGERGAEAVVPLTDSQQMMLLGEAIGRYITVNANITNTMNGRVISREIQKVQNETNFATNR